MNIPEDKRTEECPEFLRSLSEKDKGIIGTPDSEYRVATWPEVQKIVADNRLGAFRRIPSHLRRYLEYTWQLKRDYGSIMKFVLDKRLRWEAPVTPRGKPFEFNDDDITILWNDWPYGIDDRIVHLVVWTKFELPEDPATGDITDETRGEIDQYVQKTFGCQVPRDRVSGIIITCLLLPYIVRAKRPGIVYLVQELEVAEVRSCCRAFPRHAS